MKHKLCHINEIPESESKEFTIETGKQNLELFVTHSNGQFFAYKNSCPHTGVSLNWQPDSFLDINKNFIQCSMHNALFEIESGYCVAGPCQGSSLAELDIKICDEMITVLF